MPHIYMRQTSSINLRQKEDHFPPYQHLPGANTTFSRIRGLSNADLSPENTRGGILPKGRVEYILLIEKKKSPKIGKRGIETE